MGTTRILPAAGMFLGTEDAFYVACVVSVNASVCPRIGIQVDREVFNLIT
jgi:hypothetical protein